MRLLLDAHAFLWFVLDDPKLSPAAVALVSDLRISQARWELFAQVHHNKQMENDGDSLLLLLNRCLTEYRYYDEDMELKQWCDVHPLLEGFDQFKVALTKLKAEAQGEATGEG